MQTRLMSVLESIADVERVNGGVKAGHAAEQ
jgi:hypothetical protein